MLGQKKKIEFFLTNNRTLFAIRNYLFRVWLNMDECSLVTFKCCLLLRKGNFGFKLTWTIAHYDKGEKRFLFLCHYLHFRGLMGSLGERVGRGENKNHCQLADLYFFVQVTQKLSLNWDMEKHICVLCTTTL